MGAHTLASAGTPITCCSCMMLSFIAIRSCVIHTIPRYCKRIPQRQRHSNHKFPYFLSNLTNNHYIDFLSPNNELRCCYFMYLVPKVWVNAIFLCVVYFRQVDLQRRVDHFAKYCKTEKLKENIDKTTVTAFKIGRAATYKKHFYLINDKIEVVDFVKCCCKAYCWIWYESFNFTTKAC